jgi:hypothetical protein
VSFTWEYGYARDCIVLHEMEVAQAKRMKMDKIEEIIGR